MSSSPEISTFDEAMMARALELAARGRGTAAPNPCVGALLARDGRVVAEGWHERYGGPHAEVNCLAEAADSGVDPASCDLYVTLEPCNHWGKTPPCSRAVLEAGVRRVVVGCADPNPEAGGGAAFLRENGVEVVLGVLERQCLDMIADFLVFTTTDRAYGVLKLAATLDGRIATRTGHSHFVSGETSRRRVQDMRRRSDAILVGGGTFRQDNPRLTVRGGDGALAARQPLAVVATTRLPGPDADSYLVRQRPGETIFWTNRSAAASDAADRLRDRGVRVWSLGPRGEMDLAAGFRKLRQEAGCHYVLCEGGGGLAMSLLEAGLMDELRLFLAPKVLGDAGAIACFSGREVALMGQAHNLRFAGMERCGEDALLTLRPKDALL